MTEVTYTVLSEFWSRTLCAMLNDKLFEWSSWKPIPPFFLQPSFGEVDFIPSDLPYINLREEKVTVRNKCLSHEKKKYIGLSTDLNVGCQTVWMLPVWWRTQRNLSQSRRQSRETKTREEKAGRKPEEGPFVLNPREERRDLRSIPRDDGLARNSGRQCSPRLRAWPKDN